MRNWTIFILVFIGSLFQETRACWFYPYGEELRVSFLNPALFNLQQWRTFHYSARSFEPDDPLSWDDPDANIGMWVTYCNNQVPVEAIREAVYGYSYETMQKDTANLMLRYLRNKRDQHAIEYLKFAKSCEIFNRFHSDPWERNEMADKKERSKLMMEAISGIHQKNLHPQIRKRYAFLAIRLAFYNNNPSAVMKLFDEHFRDAKQRDILYYWSLHFRNLHQNDSVRRSFEAAQIFMNAPDKRFAVLSSYGSKIGIAPILALATSNQERSNVHAIRAILRHDKALWDLREIYRLTPRHEAINILIIREINKLEDWIYTPYYTNWQPSVATNWSWLNGTEDDEQINTYALLQKRIRDDRVYAGEVLRFLNTIDPRVVNDRRLLEAARIQLLFMTAQYHKCIKTIEVMLKQLPSDDLLVIQLMKMNALCLTANQQKGKAIIPAAIEKTLLKFSNDNRFMFAIARELEYLGNHTLAAAIYANIKYQYLSPECDQLQTDSNQSLYWKDRKSHTIVYDDYFHEYFNYLNFNYTTDQLEDVVASINHPKTDTFDHWLTKGLTRDRSRLLDMLGTKYIRLDQLKDALRSFEKIPDDYWLAWYTPWERNDVFYLFDQDPFYELKYTPHFIDQPKQEVLNKRVITSRLIDFLERANNPKEKDRDYYYFLVANCYYNMSYYGNSWMMRRFFRSNEILNSGHVDEKEYYQCNLASLYYNKARQHAKQPPFEALCVAMMSKCERHRLGYIYNVEREDLTWQEREKILQKRNRYTTTLFNEYPEYADDLTSSCELFKTLFDLRR
jgi:hypothetical protein